MNPVLQEIVHSFLKNKFFFTKFCINTKFKSECEKASKFCANFTQNVSKSFAQFLHNFFAKKSTGNPYPRASCICTMHTKNAKSVLSGLIQTKV